MRYLMVTYADPEAPEPTPEALAALGQLAEEGVRDGWMVDTGGIQWSDNVPKVKYENGDFKVLDGPFAESKEVIAGYVIVDVPSLDDAVALSKRFYEVMGNGEGEIRQMFSTGDGSVPQG